jgi:hypothetical protein
VFVSLIARGEFNHHVSGEFNQVTVEFNHVCSEVIRCLR